MTCGDSVPSLLKYHLADINEPWTQPAWFPRTFCSCRPCAHLRVHLHTSFLSRVLGGRTRYRYHAAGLFYPPSRATDEAFTLPASLRGCTVSPPHWWSSLVSLYLGIAACAHLPATKTARLRRCVARQEGEIPQIGCLLHCLPFAACTHYAPTTPAFTTHAPYHADHGSWEDTCPLPAHLPLPPVAHARAA